MLQTTKLLLLEYINWFFIIQMLNDYSEINILSILILTVIIVNTVLLFYMSRYPTYIKKQSFIIQIYPTNIKKQRGKNSDMESTSKNRYGINIMLNMETETKTLDLNVKF